jgi:glycosyltransferase involved in cell wall biosynthesis
MKHDIRLLALVHGSPFDSKSWSGTNADTLHNISELCTIVAAYDIETYGFWRNLNILREFRFNKYRWKSNYRLSQKLRNMRMRKANGYVSKHIHDINAIFQMGAKFLIEPRENVVISSYHDNTMALSTRGGRYSFNHNASPAYEKRAYAWERDVYNSNDVIFTFSECVKKSIVDDFGVAPDKIHVTYAGVSVISMDKVTSTLQKFRNQKILFIGKDFERKGGWDVLAAFKKVREKFPNCELHIAGSDPSVTGQGVFCYGYIDQQTPDGRQRIARLYDEATVFTMPSHFEPFGKPFCEAMVYGTPSIGTNISAMPEIIDHGINGYCIIPGDTEALASHLAELLSDYEKYQSFSQASIEKSQSFRWPTVVRKMVTAISAAISNRHNFQS